MNSSPCVMIIAQGIYLQISGIPSFSELQLIFAFNGKAIDKCLLPFFPTIINLRYHMWHACLYFLVSAYINSSARWLKKLFHKLYIQVQDRMQKLNSNCLKKLCFTHIVTWNISSFPSFPKLHTWYVIKWHILILPESST